MVEFMRVSDVFGRLSFVNELGNMLIRNSFEVPHETLPSTVSNKAKKETHNYDRQCKLGGIYFVFFSPHKKKKGNPNPHCSTFPSPHKPTPKPKACKRAAILPAHRCLIVTFEL